MPYPNISSTGKAGTLNLDHDHESIDRLDSDGDRKITLEAAALVLIQSIEDSSS